MNDGSSASGAELAAGAAALQQVAFVGPFFAVTVANSCALSEGWRHTRELLDDPEVLHRRIAGTRAAMAIGAGIPVSSVEPKVAASAVQLALSARLLSPAVAAALVTGWLPLVAPSTLWWRPGDADPVRLAVPATLEARRCASAEELVDALASELLPHVLSPLVEATQVAVSVSRLVLRGNVASAFSTAVALTVRAVPTVQPLGRAVLDGILARPVLAGTSSGAAAHTFRRTSCCLIYRLPGAGICGDCVLKG